MGAAMSEEECRERRRRDMEETIKKYKRCPDVTVNRAIVMFCSLSSSDSLQQHFNKRRQKDFPHAAWITTLAEKLSSLSENPKMAGLGALAIAVFIDAISATSSSDDMKNALRCVFAEEKASEVWDQIDECLRRCVMHIDDDDELMGDIKRMEWQLSAALTKLKNSMWRDGHMSSQALKAWVNGTAFHIQMLIHLVRLGGIQTCNPVERLLSAYLSDLDLLFKKHEEAVEKKCMLRYNISEDCYDAYFETEEGEALHVTHSFSFGEWFKGYYEEHYVSQKHKIRRYFRDIRDDLPKLVRQVSHLKVC